MAYVDIEKRATRTNSSTESLKQKGESKTSLLRKSWLFHFFFFFSFQSYINHLLQFRICHVTPKTEIRRRCQNLSSFFVKRDDLKYFAVAGSAGEDSVLCNCLWAAWSRQQLRFLKRGTRHRNLISTLISFSLLFFFLLHSVDQSIVSPRTCSCSENSGQSCGTLEMLHDVSQPNISKNCRSTFVHKNTKNFNDQFFKCLLT